MELDVEVLRHAAKELKMDFDEIKDDLKIVVYTDGGATKPPNGLAGAGVHGYVYVDKDVKTNSNAPDGHSPTSKGYLPKAEVKGDIYKVAVLSYFDIARPLGVGTNNVAELSAGIDALTLIRKAMVATDFKVTEYYLLSDAEYFVSHFNDSLEKWHERDYVNGTGGKLANVELWQQLYELKGDVKDHGKIVWVKAHDGEAGNTKADYLATCAVNMSINGSTEPAFVHQYQKDYGDSTHSLSPLFTEKRFFIQREHINNRLYYQLSMGKRWPGDEEGKRESVGKRISDTCASVIYTEKHETVIDDLADFSREQAGLPGLMYGRLDFLNKGSLYNDLDKLGVNILRCDGQEILLPLTEVKTVLMSELDPARLSWRLAQRYEALADMLMNFVQHYPDEPTRLLYEVQEITGQIYLIKEGKTKTYELYDDDEDASVIPVNAFVGDSETKIDLSMDVDIPSLASLKRLGKLLPEVYLLTWRDHQQDRAVSYAVVFKVGGDTGLWTSAYSNVHFLSHS